MIETINAASIASIGMPVLKAMPPPILSANNTPAETASVLTKAFDPLRKRVSSCVTSLTSSNLDLNILIRIRFAASARPLAERAKTSAGTGPNISAGCAATPISVPTPVKIPMPARRFNDIMPSHRPLACHMFPLPAPAVNRKKSVADVSKKEIFLP